MSLDPALRFQSATELVDELLARLAELSDATSLASSSGREWSGRATDTRTFRAAISTPAHREGRRARRWVLAAMSVVLLCAVVVANLRRRINAANGGRASVSPAASPPSLGLPAAALAPGNAGTPALEPKPALEQSAPSTSAPHRRARTQGPKNGSVSSSSRVRAYVDPVFGIEVPAAGENPSCASSSSCSP